MQIIYQNKGNFPLYSNIAVKIDLEYAHSSSVPVLSANRDKSLKSSVNTAKSEFRKLQFAPLNFTAITFKDIFECSFNVLF